MVCWSHRASDARCGAGEGLLHVGIAFGERRSEKDEDPRKPMEVVENTEHEIGSGRAGSLRIGASTTPGVHLLPAVLRRFHSEFPQIQIALTVPPMNAKPPKTLPSTTKIPIICCI